MNIRIVTTIALLVTGIGLAGCSSSGGGSSAALPQLSRTSVSGAASSAARVGCPLNATAVSAAVEAQLVEMSPATFHWADGPVLCGFRTSSQPGLTVQIAAFPFTSGRDKNKSLASIKDDLKAAVGVSKSQGLTYQIHEHPEWGANAFTLVEYDSGKVAGVQVWTPKYSSAIFDDAPGISESVYLADAAALGDVLVRASR